MNRIFFIALACTALFFAACKENDIPLPSGISSTPATDSTYVLSSVPAADPHNVLVEEFTGQSCSNCPAAHAALETIAASGNVNIIGLYISSSTFTQTFPPTGAVYDFRTSLATQLSDLIYGSVSSIPSGGIDRTPVAGTVLLFQNQWSSQVTTQKAMVDSVNLAVESSYSGATATIKATITYLKPMTTPLNISIAIVEDSMVDIQEEPYPVNYDSTYTFTNVCRDMVTAIPLGDHILDTIATKPAGTVYWRKYSYTLPVKTPAINPARCRVIAFVNTRGTSGDYRILQSAKTNLKP